MNPTVVGRLFFVTRNDTARRARTLSFLQDRGFFSDLKFDDELNDREVVIEFREMPRVLLDLFNTGQLRPLDGGRYRLDVMELSERGVLFYLAYSKGDDLVFVPQHHIVAVHTVTSQRLLDVRNSTR